MTKIMASSVFKKIKIFVILASVLIAGYIFFSHPENWTIGKVLDEAAKEGADLKLASALTDINLIRSHFRISNFW